MSTLGVSDVLGAAIGDGDDVGRIKLATHLVVVEVGILAAVVSVNGAEEVAKDVVVLIRLHLEKSGALGVDDGVSHVKVQKRLATSIVRAVGGSGTVDEIQLGTGPGRNVRGSSAVEKVKVLLIVDVAKGLVDAETVGAVGASSFRDFVEVGDAVGGNDLGANLQISSCKKHKLALILSCTFV